MKSTSTKTIVDGITLDPSPLDTLLKANLDGAGIFELLNITSARKVSEYIKIVKKENVESKYLNLELTQMETEDYNISPYLSSLFTSVEDAQKILRSSKDPAIRFEISAIEAGTHSRFIDLARPEAPDAAPPSYPHRSHPAFAYRLLENILSTETINSVTFLTHDIGLIHIASNALIFRKIASKLGGAGIGNKPVKLGNHPDYRCWDEGGHMYKLPGWPDWASKATWFDNLPLQSDLHVMELNDDFDHFELVEKGSRYSSSTIVLLINTQTTPQCKLHPTYKWFWHPSNIFLGVLKSTSQALLAVITDSAFALGMELTAAMSGSEEVAQKFHGEFRTP